MNSRTGGLAGCLLALLPPLALAQPSADKAHAILKAHCHRCHGENGSAKGKFGYVLARDKLIARGKVVPGNAAESELYQRVQSGEMPPAGKTSRPSKDEILALRQWIDAGAPGIGTTVARSE